MKTETQKELNEAFKARIGGIIHREIFNLGKQGILGQVELAIASLSIKNVAASIEQLTEDFVNHYRDIEAEDKKP